MKKNNIHFQFPKAVKTPDRFRNPISKYTIRRNARCISCGLCAELCPYGVHPRYDDYAKPLRPLDYKCIGFKCKENDYFCIDRCPEQALTLRRNPILDTLGDYRWTAEMLIGHWEMAETGNLPVVDLEYSLGNSGGGFDKIRFKIPDPDDYLNLTDRDMDTSVTLNKRGDGRPVWINAIPCYGGGMSYGSTALSVMISRAQAATLLNTLNTPRCTFGQPSPYRQMCTRQHCLCRVCHLRQTAPSGVGQRQVAGSMDIVSETKLSTWQNLTPIKPGFIRRASAHDRHRPFG